MQQLQIEFFWPLTEQIPLDLDYTGCEKPKLSVPFGCGNTFKISDNTFKNLNVTATHLVLDIESTVIKTKETPRFYRKILYKLLGIRWEKK